MKHTHYSLLLIFTIYLLLLLTLNAPRLAFAQSEPSSSLSQASALASTTINFDHFKIGPVPKEFRPFLGGLGKDVSWEIRADPSALSDKNVLTQTSYEKIDYRFPLLVYNNVTAKNVYVAVQFKPVSGTIEQAAGIIVRFQDPEHYYVVRAHALEDKVQLYRVVKDVRQIIVGESAHVASGQWHSLEVVAKDDQFTVFFDGQQLFEVRDETFLTAGKVGLSTKSDGVTIFDDLQVKVLDQHDGNS